MTNSSATSIQIASRSRNAVLFAERMRPHFVRARGNGAHTDKAVAEFFNAEGLRTQRGTAWTKPLVTALRNRLAIRPLGAR